MHNRFFDHQQEKIQPVGLQYIIRKYDMDFTEKRSVFYGVELVFDCEANMKLFQAQLNRIDDPQLSASFSYREKIGHIINKNNKLFCQLGIVMNSRLYGFNQKSICNIEGELILKELNEKVQLANIAVLSFDFNDNKFLELNNNNDDDFADAPDHLTCPLSLDLMQDPITVSSGITYDRSALRDVSAHQGNPQEIPCPITKLPIKLEELHFKTNVTIKELVAKHKALKANDNKDKRDEPMEGVQRFGK